MSGDILSLFSKFGFGHLLCRLSLEKHDGIFSQSTQGASRYPIVWVKNIPLCKAEETACSLDALYIYCAPTSENVCLSLSLVIAISVSCFITEFLQFLIEHFGLLHVDEVAAGGQFGVVEVGI